MTLNKYTMPRTKINHNAKGLKRNRENNAEIEEILRDFDIEGENTKKFVCDPI